MHLAVALALTLVLGACAPAPEPDPVRVLFVDPIGPSPKPSIFPASCAGTLEYPDPICTPGAVVSVTKDQICSRPAVHDSRPPVSWTTPVKARLVRIYGAVAGTDLGGYELDHLVPLELGGAGWDVRNLWPEPVPTPNPKDRVENAAKIAVCAGKLPLDQAQREIARDWKALGRSLGVA